MKKKSILGLMFIALIGCDSEPVPDLKPMKPELRYKSKIIRVLWPDDATQMPSYLEKELMPWVRQSKKTESTSTSVHIDIPSQWPIQKIRALRSFWSDQGLRLDTIHENKKLPRNYIRVVAYQVILPVCGQWDKPISGYANAIHANYACATVYNHLASLRDPIVLFKVEDLQSHDAELAIKAIDNLYKTQQNPLNTQTSQSGLSGLTSLSNSNSQR